MPGIPINSLQDLLILRELKNQADPFRSAVGALAQGVAAGIEEKREEAKLKKQQEEQLQKTIDMASKFGNTNSSKIKTSISAKGEPSFAIEPYDKSAEEFKIKREERIASQAELSNTTKLRQEFINRPEVKDYVAVSTNVNAMEGLLNKALQTDNKENLVAVDQGLITMYNKLTDPASVVRESEYARTPGNLPIVNRFYGALAKLQQGGAGLTNDDRKALVEGAKIIIKERGNQYNKTLNEYNDLANSYGLDINKVTRGMKEFSESTIPVDLEPIKVYTTKSGNTYRRLE